LILYRPLYCLIPAQAGAGTLLLEGGGGPHPCAVF